MNSTEQDHTSSLINSLEELCGDDDKFFSVNHGDQNLFHSNLYGNNSTTTTSTHFGFSLDLSVLQNQNNSPRISSDLDEQLHRSPPQPYASSISPRYQTRDSNDTRPSPRRDNENFPLDPLGHVDSIFGQSETRQRHESEGYYSPRNLTPRELTTRKESENYYYEQSHPSRRDEPYYSPRDKIRSTDAGYSGGAPIPNRRENETLFPNNPPRGRQEGYYSPRDRPQGSMISTLSPRDGHYPERPISRESESYYGSREPTPRDHNFRRDSTDSGYYPSPRDSIPSPRAAPNDNYYGGSRELTPREQIRRNSAEYYASSKAEIPSDKSVPNPYAPPFVPQRSVSSSSYGVPNLSFPPQFLNQNPRQPPPPTIPYDYLQRPNNFQYPGDNGNRQSHIHPYRNQYNESMPPTLQHAAPYQPPDQLTQPHITSQRPNNVPPLSFSGLSSGEYTSTDSEESNSTSGYFSPKYGNAAYSRSFSGQQLRPSPASGRPHPLLKSNSEKMFDPRGRIQTFSARGNYKSTHSTHTSSTGNLSGRGKYSPDEEKAIYYQITPQTQFSVPPLPIFPLKILSIDVNGSFNATDDTHTSPRNAFFDFIEETKAQVVLMYNTGLENEDQLKIVRNEVKAKYNTESAMWASFKGPGPDGGRGVGVLVLGPLAPRTGWIVSDSCGHLLSASSRVKPGLPVLCFIACDCFVPPLDPTPFESLQANLPIPRPPGDLERKNKVIEKLKEIMSTEQEKGVFIFAAGEIFHQRNENDDHHDDDDDDDEEKIFQENGMIRMSVTRHQEEETVIDPITPSSSTQQQKQQQQGELSDVLVTRQPFGDGPRPPDGTGMKVLSTETIPSQLSSPHEPTLIQIAVYGWPSETFAFSQKSDTPLSSGRKSRRSKSGRKKDDLSPQLQQVSFSAGVSPRGGGGISTHSDLSSTISFPYPLMQPSQPSTLLEAATSQQQHTQQQHTQQQGMNLNSPRIDLNSWKMKIIEYHSRLNDLLHSTSWGVVRLDQMKYLLHEILIFWMTNGGNNFHHLVDVPGFPSSKSLKTLQEIFSFPADPFLNNGPEMISQILQSWLSYVDEILMTSRTSPR